MDLSAAPHGVNLVLETDDAVFVGRFDSLQGLHALLHDACARRIVSGAEREAFVREVARYGVPVEEKSLHVDALAVRAWRRLGDVPKT